MVLGSKMTKLNTKTLVTLGKRATRERRVCIDDSLDPLKMKETVGICIASLLLAVLDPSPIVDAVPCLADFPSPRLFFFHDVIISMVGGGRKMLLD